ncbi:hypothetical protein [Winogradskyella alexanderae]|uniref:Uncharacterized protein n=1 Tax=Winogradskyella alexanderae TaxID=2877123 RepID=A0ABS7XQH3_9FLAO|nr:hypothetical protein [Winogradskyella alexanderae]MCA0131774.1 hypothetical protein [Winogradskyella alexanderae]
MKKKSSRLKKVLKIIGGLIIFFTLPSLLFFGFLYIKYNEDLPNGIQGKEADALASRMLETLDYEAYNTTDYLEWIFSGRHSFKWYKTKERCEVYWSDFKVDLNLKNTDSSKVFVAEQIYNGEDRLKLIGKAEAIFNNDSFWLVAPYKAFDDGVERRLVTDETGKQSLLVTYTTGGTTPGDSYLWHFDDSGKPKSYQMWVDILPIKGLPATWENWITTDSGAQLPTLHKLLFFSITLEGVKGVVNEN